MTEKTTKYTASEAIEAVEGMTRNRFYEMIERGNISYDTEPWGKKERKIFDASELARVFGGKFKIDNPRQTTETNNQDNSKQHKTTETILENKLLEQENKFLLEQVSGQKQQLHELRTERDNWKEQADKLTETVTRQTYLLEHHTKQPEKPLEAQSPDVAEDTAPKRTNALLVAFVFVLALLLGGVLALLIRQDKINLSSFLPSLLS